MCGLISVWFNIGVVQYLCGSISVWFNICAGQCLCGLISMWVNICVQMMFEKQGDAQEEVYFANKYFLANT